MEFSNLKFNETDFIGKDVSSLPDRVVGRAEYLKKMFDNLAKNEIALGRFNSLMDVLERYFNPVYFHARGTETYLSPGTGCMVGFGTVINNMGGFELEGTTVLKFPESGIYLLTLNANASYGQDKDIRFFIRPDGAGLTLRPGINNGKCASQSACCVSYKEKGESVYIECDPQSAFTLNDRTLAAALLYRV